MGDDSCQTALQIENERGKISHTPTQEQYDDDGHPRRIGNLWTASSHIITAIIGSGVLSLAWSFAQMGWIAGCGALIFFAFVTYYTSFFLIDCYRHPDPVYGKRNYTYMDAVRTNLGPLQFRLCGFIQYTNLWATAIGFTITASTSMVAIKRSNCYHLHGKYAECKFSNNFYMAIFGFTEIILSQIPNFHRMWWLSVIAAIMSLCYSSVGLGLEIRKTLESSNKPDGHAGRDIGLGFDKIPRMIKIWQIFQALGNIAFAYSYSAILIEIQDTLKNPPSEKKTMRKATLIGVSTTTFFYMSIGCMGYAAFGRSGAPGNLLSGFGFYNPYWLIDFANVCILMHLVGAYQVFSQPLFAVMEGWVAQVWPETRYIHYNYALPLPIFGALPIHPFRILWRTLFVTITTLVAALLPFFNDVVGLIGAYGFWPLTVYFPVSMYINRQRIQRWSLKWTWLQLLSFTCLLVSIAAGVGSLEGIYQALKHYTPFEIRD